MSSKLPNIRQKDGSKSPDISKTTSAKNYNNRAISLENGNTPITIISAPFGAGGAAPQYDSRINGLWEANSKLKKQITMIASKNKSLQSKDKKLRE